MSYQGTPSVPLFALSECFNQKIFLTLEIHFGNCKKNTVESWEPGKITVGGLFIPNTQIVHIKPQLITLHTWSWDRPRFSSLPMGKHALMQSKDCKGSTLQNQNEKKWPP